MLFARFATAGISQHLLPASPHLGVVSSHRGCRHAILGQKLLFDLFKRKVRPRHASGNRIRLEIRNAATDVVVEIHPRHAFAQIHLEDFKVLPFIAPWQHARVAQVVRPQREVPHAHLLPALYHGLAVVQNRGNHAQEGIVRISQPFTARWMLVGRIGVGADHHVRAQGDGLGGHPVAEVQVAIRLVHHERLVRRKRTVQGPTFVAQAELFRVVCADVEETRLAPFDPVVYDLIHHRLIRHAKLHDTIVHGFRIAAPAPLAIFAEGEVFRMVEAESAVPVREGMPEHRRIPVPETHPQQPPAVVFHNLGRRILGQSHRRGDVLVERQPPIRIKLYAVCADAAHVKDGTILVFPVLGDFHTLHRLCDDAIVAGAHPADTQRFLDESVHGEERPGRLGAVPAHGVIAPQIDGIAHPLAV